MQQELKDFTNTANSSESDIAAKYIFNLRKFIIDELVI